MSNFAECTLVKIVPSEPYFAALTTYDINHGRSSRFLLRLNDLATLVTDENANPVLDTDIGSYIEITRRSMHLHFKLTLLHQDYRNNVTGYVQCFELPICKVFDLLCSKSIHHVHYERDGREKAQMSITESGHQQIRSLCRNKLTKHALRRFFRDNFNYGSDELVMIYPDTWVNGFYFQGDWITGGIVRHEDIITGKNGREYKKVFFAVHT